MSKIAIAERHEHENGYHFDHMPEKQEFYEVAEIFKLLSDANRLRLFWILCHCEECVLNLSLLMEMSSPAISHHLKLLKNSHLIVSRREGKEVIYKAAETQQVQALHHMIEKMVEISCPRK